MNQKTKMILAASRWIAVYVLAGMLPAAQAENRAAIIDRVAADIRYLASDELEGRGPQTAGLEKAATYIRGRFESLGLRGPREDGAFSRPFDIQVDTSVVEAKTSLVLRGPEGEELRLELGKDFQPLAVGGGGKVKAEVVFAGYGISAPKYKYDDYANADVAGKVVLIIRREPQQDKDDSVFEGKKTTQYAFIRSKLQAAKKSKAAAVLLVNDPFTTAKEKKDPLSSPGGFGGGGGNIPFAQVTQHVVDLILSESPLKVGDDQRLTSVKQIGERIDAELTPLTQPLGGWTAELELTFESVKAKVANVVGVLEGTGPLADETIVIGAHYDHLGYGPFGSRRPNEHKVHNGADDNASGTAAVLELARRFAGRDKPPARRLVFAAFTAEERGLVGSNYYLEHPAFPLEKTIAMINFDMIGSLGEKGLLVGGAASGDVFASLVEKESEGGKLEVKSLGTLGGSDHAGFYRKGIPVLFFFTGMTDRYHTPDDDFELINVEGEVRTIDFAEGMLNDIANLPKRPEYKKVAQPQRGRGSMAYLGVVPDYAGGDGNGLRLTDVNADSPASRAGLKTGDVIVKFGDVDVADIQGLAAGLRKYKAGQKVEIVVRRDDHEKTLTVTLGEPRGAR